MCEENPPGCGDDWLAELDAWLNGPDWVPVEVDMPQLWEGAD